MAAAALRINYLFTCLAGAAFTVWLLSGVPRELAWAPPHDRGVDFESLGWMAMGIVVFGATSARGLWRFARRRPLVEKAIVAECWALAALVMFASLLAHFLVLNVFLAIWSAYPDFDGNAAGPLLLAVMAYAFSLLTVELVLVGMR